MMEQLDAWARAMGPWGPWGLFLASFLEYVFPPFPGDSVVLFGGALVGRGTQSAIPVGVALFAGNLLGICASWVVGRLIGRRVDRLPEGRLVPGVTHASIRKAQEAMQRRGTLLLLTHRFLPTFRTTLLLAAGASGLPLGKVLWAGGLSGLAWSALLIGVGATVGDNAESLQAFLTRYQRGAVAAVAVVALLLLLRLLVTRRRTARR